MSTLPVKTCRVCAEERVMSAKGPRTLRVLPTWTKGSNQKQQKYPVYVCEFCDGPVFEMSLRKNKAE